MAKLSQMRDKAAIWDLDGVIVDSAAAHFTAWRELCLRHGRDLTEDEFKATFGQRNEEIIARLFGIGDVARDREAERAMAEEKEALFRGIAGDHVRLLPGVSRLLSDLREAGYAQAIGSSAPRLNVELMLSAVNLRDQFSVLVCEEDVTRGKPAPEIFLAAAQRLGVAANRCVVIEDAVAGVSAAKAAGMACVAVTNTRDRQALREADLIVDSLEYLDEDTLSALIARENKDR